MRLQPVFESRVHPHLPAISGIPKTLNHLWRQANGNALLRGRLLPASNIQLGQQGVRQHVVRRTEVFHVRSGQLADFSLGISQGLGLWHGVLPLDHWLCES